MSLYATTIARLEFFQTFMYWLLRAGTMLLRACGMITSLSLWKGVRPNEIPASICPRGRDWMLPLTISATIALV